MTGTEYARLGLFRAIRTITNDSADGHPNNESEAQLVALRGIMDPHAWGTGVPEKAARQYQKACYALEALAEALGGEAMSLRLSAEEYFGEDFARADP